jgi:hypothetical protein
MKPKTAVASFFLLCLLLAAAGCDLAKKEKQAADNASQTRIVGPRNRIVLGA